MGQRAVGSLLLGLLLLHARLLAVSVRDRGQGARANLAGTPEAARLGLWPGTAAPAKDPGLALASATLQRGAFLGDAPGIPCGGQGAVPASVEIGGSPATLFRLKVASGHGPACSSGVWGG